MQLNGPGTGDDGVAIHAGFGVEALLSDLSRACILDRVFTADFGLGATLFGACPANGVDAPIAASPRSGFELAAARPNPFVDGTSLAWSVPVRGRVRIELYDVLGRRVRTLVDEIVDPGRYERAWDGRTDDGRRVSSGLYFAKMTAGKFGATRKLVLLH